MKQRCAWAKGEFLTPYHDQEWGVPLHDDQRLFELLLLEGMQAGLSWELILKKRAAYREAFHNFDPARMVKLNIDDLLQNPGLIRNRLKLQAALHNAQVYLDLPESLDSLVWSFVGGAPQINRWSTLAEVPCETETSAAMSKALKKRGFKFVGPTICYSFMQAAGLVNDHTTDCFLA